MAAVEVKHLDGAPTVDAPAEAPAGAPGAPPGWPPGPTGNHGGWRHGAGLGGQELRVGALELRHPPALVVQLLPVEPVHEVILRKLPEIYVSLHTVLLLKKLF